jgi:hypothetical protein
MQGDGARKWILTRLTIADDDALDMLALEKQSEREADRSGANDEHCARFSGRATIF